MPASHPSIQYQLALSVTPTWLLRNWGSLLFPDLSKRGAQLERNFQALVARTDDQTIVGLLVFNDLPKHRTVRIHSWYVMEHFRNRGIGGQLLLRTVKFLRNQRLDTVSLVFREGWSYSPVVRWLLQKHSWPEPKLWTVVAKADLSTARQLFQLRPEKIAYSFFSFNQLKFSDQSSFYQEILNDTTVPYYLKPTIDEHNIVESASLFLVGKEKECLGWIVARPIRRGVAEISTFFLHLPARQFGTAYRMVAESLLLLERAGFRQLLFSSRMDGSPLVSYLLKKEKRITFDLDRQFFTELVL